MLIELGRISINIVDFGQHFFFNFNSTDFLLSVKKLEYLLKNHLFHTVKFIIQQKVVVPLLE